MLRQYGRRGTIAAAVVAFITIFALLNILEPFNYGKSTAPQPAETKIEETTHLEEETFTSDDQPADALIDEAKAALEKDAAKSEEEKQAVFFLYQNNNRIFSFNGSCIQISKFENLELF